MDRSLASRAGERGDFPGSSEPAGARVRHAGERVAALRFEETADGEPLVVSVAVTDAWYQGGTERALSWNGYPGRNYLARDTWVALPGPDGTLRYAAYDDFYRRFVPPPKRTLAQVFRGENREPAWDSTMFTDERDRLVLRPGIDDRFAPHAMAMLVGHAAIKWGGFYGTVRGPAAEIERFRESAERRRFRVYDMDREEERVLADLHFRADWRDADYDRRPDWARPLERAHERDGDGGYDRLPELVRSRERDDAGAERDL